jgi:hypothetical protein
VIAFAPRVIGPMMTRFDGAWIDPGAASPFFRTAGSLLALSRTFSNLILLLHGDVQLADAS